MNKLRHYLHARWFPTLAIVCTVGSACAQEFAPGPNTLPIIINPKQVAELAVTQPAPEYPPVARINYLQGIVQIELTINGKGNVANVHVVEGNPILAIAALDAARRWAFHPLATAAGPSGFVTMVRLKFTLGHPVKDLTPRQAEKDFERQVKPPRMSRPPEHGHPEQTVHMRLLVNEQGEVVDRAVSPLGDPQFEAACQTLRSWTFSPAHWGSIPIASYVMVDVPVSAPSVTRDAAYSATH